MSLTWGGIKQLVRLHAVVEELSVLVHNEEQGKRRDLEEQLQVLIDVVHEALADADTALAEEFERIVIAAPGRRLPLTARVASLAGWLKGAVEAETLEVRIRIGEDRPRAQRLASVAGGGDEAPARLPRTR
jgi:hypothetical protein